MSKALASSSALAACDRIARPIACAADHSRSKTSLPLAMPSTRVPSRRIVSSEMRATRNADMATPHLKLENLIGAAIKLHHDVAAVRGNRQPCRRVDVADQ